MPAQVIRAIIDAHAGLHPDSGRLPLLEKQDEKGHLYAAALPRDLLPDTPPPIHKNGSQQHTPLTFDSPEIMGHRAPPSYSPSQPTESVSDML